MWALQSLFILIHIIIFNIIVFFWLVISYEIGSETARVLSDYLSNCSDILSLHICRDSNNVYTPAYVWAVMHTSMVYTPQS